MSAKARASGQGWSRRAGTVPEASGGQDELWRRAALRGAPKSVVERARHEQTHNPRDVHTAERLDQWAGVERRGKKGDLNQDPDQVDCDAGHIPSAIATIRVG